MSVLMKGMEMPKACEWCSFISTFTTESGLGCRCEVERFEFWDYSKRQENCPLVEIPTPHGRLIDVDAFVKKLKRLESSEEPYQRGMVKAFLDVISCEPTIIEAEVSE